MSRDRWNTAIVVGASSGIGEAIARRLAADGVQVVLAARRGDELSRITGELGEGATVQEHDVTDYESVPALWNDLETELGAVDLLVYCAGVMADVELHEYTFHKDRRMIEVNVLGAIAWLDQAAVRMQAARSGTIVGVSSVAGDRGRMGRSSTSLAARSIPGCRNPRLNRRCTRRSTAGPPPVPYCTSTRCGERC